MKYRDVLFTVLSEMTGRPLEQIRQTFPPALNTSKMEEELSDDEASKLLDELRKEKSGILKWAMTGLKRRIANSN